MRYKNATEILPSYLIQEIQTFTKGTLLYIPDEEHKSWGEHSGSKDYYMQRNQKIKEKYKDGSSIDELSEQFGLAYHTIRKVIYSK